jgi:hypothetical protein
MLWAPLVALPLLWSAQELLGWFFASHACTGVREPASWSLGAARSGIALVSALALIAAAASLASSRARLRKPSGDADPTARERSQFVALAGVLIAVSLGLGMLFGALPLLLLSGCELLR